jgi:sec-independent protein translocase protein TatB
VNLDPDKLVVLAVLALLVLGPTRLPEVARTAGRWMAEIRKYTSAIQGELHGVLGEPLKQTSALRDEFRAAINEPQAALNEPRAALEAGASEVRTSAREIRQRLEAEMRPTGDDTQPSAGDNGAAPGGGGRPSYEPSVTARAPTTAVPDDPGLN